MNKQALKKTAFTNQNGTCDLSGNALPEETKLYDTHRPVPKRKGGNYTEHNTKAVIPLHHMKEHGSLRERSKQLETLKMIIDDREQVRKLFNKINNQLLALKRRIDQMNPKMIEWLIDLKNTVGNKLKEIDKLLTKTIKSTNDSLIISALGVRGIGPVTIAYCLVYIDLEKAYHASSLWKYTGLHCASHERYTKGESSGGNKNLRTILYTMSESQVKGRGAYRKVYDERKTRLENSNKITKSRNTQGQLIECAWKDTKPCHRHGAGLRVIMKHFLADYWYVGRTLLGLEVGPLYPEAILGGSHRTIMPEERGWVY